ncbi:MAG: acetylglutamate kinase, partial [Pseudomonadota bacterium]
LLMLTDVPGVMDENGKVMPQLSRKQALDMIRSGAIAGGMIPKVETCLEALDAGVGGVVILDGRVEHAVLLELFTEHGAGTLIS